MSLKKSLWIVIAFVGVVIAGMVYLSKQANSCENHFSSELTALRDPNNQSRLFPTAARFNRLLISSDRCVAYIEATIPLEQKSLFYARNNQNIFLRMIYDVDKDSVISYYSNSNEPVTQDSLEMICSLDKHCVSVDSFSQQFSELFKNYHSFQYSFY